MTAFLFVSIFKNKWMIKASKIFSKFIFWFENCIFYISRMLVNELLLIPFIYIRLIYNIMKVEDNIFNALLLSGAWLLIGPFYLFWGLCMDMHYYIQLLKLYHEHDFEGND